MKKWVIFALFLMFVNNGYAYLEDYPPYAFNGQKLKSLILEPLVDLAKTSYKSDNQSIEIRLLEDSNDYQFSIKVGNSYLVYKRDCDSPLPQAVYQVDVDNNGLNDFIVISSYRGCGLAANNDYVQIYLKQKTGDYIAIGFDTMAADIKDFTDINGDGVFEVIITGFYYGQKHNYFTYNVYALKEWKLVNIDAKSNSFPKFIWFADKPNDKNTTHLTKQQKKIITDEKNGSITYGKIPHI